MTEHAGNPPEMRRLLRGYLLGTLRESQRRRVEERLVDSPEWQAALEEERRGLATLDALSSKEPGRDLTAAVMRGIRDAVGRKAAARRRSRRLAFEYCVAALLVCVAAVIVLPAFSRAREAARRTSSQSNLKQLSVVFRMYAADNNGYFPPLTPYEDVWMFDVERAYSDYLGDLQTLIDPSHPEADELWDGMVAALAKDPPDWQRVTRLAAQSYTYTGYAMTNEQDLHALKQGVTQLARSENPVTLDVDGYPIYRLREGVERYFITNIDGPAASNVQAKAVLVMFEASQTARRGRKTPGRNVLYMDGNVDFIRQDMFPATQSVSEAFPPPTP